MLGPFATASRLTPIHQMSLAVLSACLSVCLLLCLPVCVGHDREPCKNG